MHANGLLKLNGIGVASVAQGGLETNTVPANGQIPIGNATNYTVANITGTTNRIVVTNGAGTINVNIPNTPSLTSVIVSDADATYINFRNFRNVYNFIEILSLSFGNASFKINPNYTTGGLALGSGTAGGSGTLDNALIYLLNFAVTNAGFYPGPSGTRLNTTYNTTYHYAISLIGTGNLNTLLLGMASGKYARTPQQYIISSTSLAIGLYDATSTNQAFKFGLAFDTATGRRYQSDTATGTTVGVTRTGPNITTSTYSSGDILIYKFLGTGSSSLDWYSVSGTTATFISKIVVTMRSTTYQNNNETVQDFHPCATISNANVFSLVAERYMNTLTYVNTGGGDYSTSTSYNLFY